MKTHYTTLIIYNQYCMILKQLIIFVQVSAISHIHRSFSVLFSNRMATGATVNRGNGGNGKWKRKTETEIGKGKWSSQQYVHSTSYQCQSSSSKSRSASLGRCKTWILDWTHELTDIWTPDKAIIDDNNYDTYAMYPTTMPLQCSV